MSETSTENVFIDANVLLDLYDETRIAHKDSLNAVTSLAQSYSVELYTSCDIITTLYYVLSKANKARALEMIIDISELCDIVEFSNNEVVDSCTLMKSDTALYKDLEDTIQLVLAQKAQCQLILSNDKGFVSPNIELMTTKQFVTSARN